MSDKASTPIEFDYIKRVRSRKGEKYEAITSWGEFITVESPAGLSGSGPMRGLAVGESWYRFIRKVGESVGPTITGGKVTNVLQAEDKS